MDGSIGRGNPSCLKAPPSALVAFLGACDAFLGLHLGSILHAHTMDAEGVADDKILLVLLATADPSFGVHYSPSLGQI